jgi:hypothetical protein
VIVKAPLDDMILSDVERRALLMLVDVCSHHSFDKIYPHNFFYFKREGLSNAFLRGTLTSLTRKGLLYFFSPEPGNEWWELGPKAAEYLERSENTSSSATGKKTDEIGDANIPASDRFVSVKDNQHILLDANESITALSELVRGSNELFADADERIQISAEINYVKELINKPKIHVLAVWDSVKNNHTLKWLVEQSVSGIVREAAVKATENLDNLLHLLLSHF